MTNRTDRAARLTGAGLMLLTGGFLIGGIVTMKHRVVPYLGENKIQENYADPGKTMIKLEDNDKNGEVETILKYDGKSYLLKVDENSRPYVQEYHVRPAEIVSGERTDN